VSTSEVNQDFVSIKVMVASGRRSGERYAECCVKEIKAFNGGSFMIWNEILSNDKCQPIIVDSNFNVRRYIDDILDPVRIPYLNTCLEILYSKMTVRG
jgi:hypothetical protein